jgi:hypothetical protein
MQQLNKAQTDKKPLERSEQEELRILRRVQTIKSKKKNKDTNDVHSVAVYEKGINAEVIVTIILHEVAPLDSSIASDAVKLVETARRHAKERCERLGYKKVVGVYFNGESWQAKLKI